METTIENVTYRIDKMPVRTQFHVLRKIGPLLTKLDKLPGLFMLAQKTGMSKDELAMVLFNAISPMLNALADLPQEDADFVMDQCLLVVHRKDEASGKFSPLFTGAMLMFPMELPLMMTVVFEVLKHNYDNFFDLLAPDTA